ncbi:MAG TPA: ATP-grasp domain-containing protein [Gemmatimonadaceae bacterium]|nr:ATP-grasp domain-containing protein [Gemmatimonadaceae bacterium]
MSENQHTHRRVLVTNGEQRATLAVVRSLGAAGHTVHVCAPRPRSLAGASRFARSEHMVANALADPAMFTADVCDLMSQLDIDTLVPMTEPALLALLPERDRLRNVLIPFADADVFSAISDKQAVLEAAARAGIATPEQTVLHDASSVFDVSSIRYPVVVKPARSVSTGAGDRLKLSVRHAASAQDLASVLREMDPRAYPLLLQQRVVGPGVGIFVLLWDGKLLAQFAHRRIREQPPSGGISVYRASIAVDPDLLARSVALLSEFAWRGVAMIEYKVDERTRTPYLMEINGRFWGSLQLAIDAGVDFPRLLIAAATGETPAPVTRFRTNVRSRWFWGDVDHLLARLRRSDAELSLPEGSPTRWNAVRDFFRHSPEDVDEIRRPGDMRPFVRESIQWFRELAR